MKICYIAHPIKGNVDFNIAMIKAIVQKINLTTDDVVPFAPYLENGLNDNIPQHRSRGIKNNIEIINRGLIDEMWLYGNKISEGMHEEIILAHRNNIKIVVKDERLEKEAYDLLKGLFFDFLTEASEQYLKINHQPPIPLIGVSNPFTIIYTHQNNSTTELEIFATDRLEAAKIAVQFVAENNLKDWQFADAHPIGTL